MGKPKRTAEAPARQRTATRPTAQVIDLATVRKAQQRELTERRVRRVLEENRAALKRLFNSGLIFTQKGSRAGRDLLGAQLALLKLIDLLSRTLEDGAETQQAREVLSRLEAHLARTSSLTARTGEYIAGRWSE